MATRDQIIEVLSEYEATSPIDLQRVVHLHEEQGGSLAELLVQEKLIDEEDLFFLMSRRLAVPAIPAERLRYLTLSPEIRRRVPRGLARECVLVPVDLDMVSGRLSVAMFDPTDHTALDKLRRVSRVTEIRAYLARRAAIIEALDTVYSDDDDALPEELREELPLLGTGVPEKEAAQAAAHDDAGAKVELDPSLAREIRAFEGIAFVQEDAEPPPGPPVPVDGAPRPPTVELEIERPVAVPSETSADVEVEVHLHGRELKGRSLLQEDRTPSMEEPGPETSRRDTDRDLQQSPEEEEQTQPFVLLPEAQDDAAATVETEVNLDDAVTEPPEDHGEFEDPEESEITQVRAIPGGQEHDVEEPTPAFAGARGFQLEGMTRELLSSVGVLVSMLSERIDPTGESYKEYGRVSRLVARELGLDELQVSRISVAAHLYGLDLALKREVGTYTDLSVAEVFSDRAVVPGGLGPSLRGLGSLVLGLRAQGGAGAGGEGAGSRPRRAVAEAQDREEHGPEPVTVRLVQLVADYIELRAESDTSTSNMETVVQLLRTGGAEPELVDALGRAVAADETPRLIGRD
jgi:hypothetical protein